MNHPQCTVCQHPQLQEIEKQIIEDVPHTTIANQYDLGNQAVRNHSINHLPKRLVLARKRKEMQHNESILDHLNKIVSDTRNILDDAIDQDQKGLALKAIKEARSNMELLSKIAVKQREYEKEDEQREQRKDDAKFAKGIEYLTTPELEALSYLQCKIIERDSNMVPDQRTEFIINWINGDSSTPNLDDIPPIYPNNNNKDSELDDVEESRIKPKKHRSKKNENDDERQTGFSQPKNPKITDEDEEMDDWDLELDDLDDENTIPSSEDDPEWLQTEREKKRKRGGFV